MAGSGARIDDSPIVLLDRRDMPLVGARLRWKRYRRWTGQRAAGMCLGCGERFTEGGEPGLSSGYAIAGSGPAGQDDYLWICAICYEGLRDHFGWVVLDTRDRPMQPAGLWESAFGFEEDATRGTAAAPATADR
jgi:hypothetical protein